MNRKQSELEAKSQKEADREKFINRSVPIVSLLVSIMALVRM